MAPSNGKASVSQDVVDVAALTDMVVTPSEHFHLPNGVTLRLKKVSRILLADAGRKVKDPPVPRVYSEEDDKWTENPLDPAYIEALQEAMYERGMRVVLVWFGMGTDVYGELPPGVPAQDSDEWLEVIESLGIDTELARKNRIIRYAMWLKYVIVADNDMFTKLLDDLRKFSGIATEEDVQKSAENFRRAETGDGSAPIDVTPTSELGDNAGQPIRGSARTGGS